jgi:flagellar biosynthesis/type III secretory pathway protein FliH
VSTEPDVPRGAEALEAVREGHRIAHAIIARAEAQAQEIKEAAREQGFEAGRRQALEQKTGELASVAAVFAAAAERFEETQRTITRELVDELPRLAVEIARRVLAHELATHPEMLVGLVRDAIVAVMPAPRLDIRVHPDDLAVLEEHRTLLAEALGGTEVRFEPSPSVGRGGCFVESPSLTLAAGVPQQLDRALKLLRGDDA